jgi:hypothetical protein
MACSPRFTSESLKSLCWLDEHIQEMSSKMPFVFKPFAELCGIVEMESPVCAGRLGWFVETNKRSGFPTYGITAAFLQDNNSHSTKKWNMRGLDCQRERAA